MFTFGAYPKRGNPLFDLVKDVADKLAVGADNKPYTSMGYANGPAAINGTRQDLTGVNITDKNYRQQATVPKGSETHSSEDVGEVICSRSVWHNIDLLVGSEY